MSFCCVSYKSHVSNIGMSSSLHYFLSSPSPFLFRGSPFQAVQRVGITHALTAEQFLVHREVKEYPSDER